MNRRQVLHASTVAMTAVLGPTSRSMAQGASRGSAEPEPRSGFDLTPLAESNPLDAKIVAFTTVSPDVAASIRFYRDVIGMTLADEGTLAADLSSAPGVGRSSSARPRNSSP